MSESLFAARFARADRDVLAAAIKELLAVWDTSADDLDSLWNGLAVRVEALRAAVDSVGDGSPSSPKSVSPGGAPLSAQTEGARPGETESERTA